MSQELEKIESAVLEAFPFAEDKLVVESLNSISVLQDHVRSQDERSGLKNRLLDSVNGNGHRRQVAINENVTDALEMMEQRFAINDDRLVRSNILLGVAFRKITALQNNVTILAEHGKRLEDFTVSIKKKQNEQEKRFLELDIRSLAESQLRQVFTTLEAGSLRALSVAGRLFWAIDSLCLGNFGDYIRSDPSEITNNLLNELRDKVRIQLEKEELAYTERFDANIWFSLSDPKNDYNQVLSFMGDWTSAESHPFSYSSTQFIHPAPAGLPFLFDGKRILDAMMYEVFEGRL